MNPLKKKDDWKAACDAVGVSYEADNNTDTLIKLVGGALGVAIKGDMKQVKKKTVAAFRDFESPSKEEKGSEKTEVKLAGEPQPVEQETTMVSHDGVLFERENDVCLSVDGKDMWFPKENVTGLTKKAGTIEIPTWLADVKFK